MKHATKKTLGFTLIELLIVISIIGLLASIVLASLQTARAKARDARRVADMRQMITALELYYNDNGGYPVQAAAQIINPSASGGIAALVSNYVSALPTAPTPGDTLTCTAANPPGVWNDYIYSASSSSSYGITFCIGTAVGSIPAGRHTAQNNGIQ